MVVWGLEYTRFFECFVMFGQILISDSDDNRCASLSALSNESFSSVKLRQEG